MTIQAKLKEKESIQDMEGEMRYIFVSARVHPCETHGSFVCEGLIHHLVNNANVSKFLRLHKIAFKIVPMLNPDGVVLGNTRVSLSG